MSRAKYIRKAAPNIKHDILNVNRNVKDFIAEQTTYTEHEFLLSFPHALKRFCPTTFAALDSECRYKTNQNITFYFYENFSEIINLISKENIFSKAELEIANDIQKFITIPTNQDRIIKIGHDRSQYYISEISAMYRDNILIIGNIIENGSDFADKHRYFLTLSHSPQQHSYQLAFHDSISNQTLEQPRINTTTGSYLFNNSTDELYIRNNQNHGINAKVTRAADPNFDVINPMHFLGYILSLDTTYQDICLTCTDAGQYLPILTEEQRQRLTQNISRTFGNVQTPNIP